MVHLTLIGGDPVLEQFCEELTRTASRISIRRQSAGDTGRSQLRITPNIAYRAIPAGAELDPFLSLLNFKLSSPPLPPEIESVLKRINRTVTIKVYIAPRCPHCPQTVSRLLTLAAANSNIGLTVIDGTHYIDEARSDQVKSTPTTILNQNLRWSGAVPLVELLNAILTGDPAGLGQDTLRRMLEEGRAKEVARMMGQSGSIFPAFIELLCHSKWPVRLAAMVAMEYLADMYPLTSAAVVEPLRKRFDALEDPVKGDLLHVLGTVGTAEASTFLHAVAGGPHTDAVKNAAAETLGDRGDSRTQSRRDSTKKFPPVD